MIVSSFSVIQTYFILNTHILPSKKHLDVRVFLDSLDSLFSWKRRVLLTFTSVTNISSIQSNFTLKPQIFIFLPFPQNNLKP